VDLAGTDSQPPVNRPAGSPHTPWASSSSSSSSQLLSVKAPVQHPKSLFTSSSMSMSDQRSTMKGVSGLGGLRRSEEVSGGLRRSEEVCGGLRRSVEV